MRYNEYACFIHYYKKVWQNEQKKDCKRVDHDDSNLNTRIVLEKTSRSNNS
jgi:hypothetical protein